MPRPLGSGWTRFTSAEAGLQEVLNFPPTVNKLRNGHGDVVKAEEGIGDHRSKGPSLLHPL